MKADAALHPSRDLLYSCSLGKLDDAASDKVLAHLQTCSQCCNEAANFTSDSFLDLLREQAGSVVFEPGQKNIETATLEAPPTTALPCLPHHAELPADVFQSMLAPARSAGELGWLGNYRILKVLGRGGMGIVFGGDDSLLKRPVALKVMRPEFAVSPDARQRFIREAQAVAALDHPNVVQIYQVGESPVLFIAMPCLAGESLAGRLQRSPLVPLADVLRIGKETAQGLEAAHAAGLIHRDIKPGNLWLAKAPTSGGQARLAENSKGTFTKFQVKILDFGLARLVDGDSNLTRPNAVLGTPAYMSPEQINGLPVTARSDLFSLGCVLYEMATGKRPFVGPTQTAILRAVADHEPEAPQSVRPEVPSALSKLIMQLLNKEPDKRPTSAAEVAQTLWSLETAETVSYIAPGPTAKWWRQHRRLILSAVAILAACFLAIGLFFSFRPSPENPPPGLGTIVLENLPPNAEVLVDGERVAVRLKDSGKLVEIEVAPGKRTLVFKCAGFKFEPEEVTLAAADRRKLQVRVVPVAPFVHDRPVYQGGVDILVWRKDGDQGHKFRLNDPGALPFIADDQIRVTARIQPAAFLYLFWIDQEGKAVPVYPWKPGEWLTRPQKESPVSALDLPEQADKGWKITKGREGMETLVMLALDAPLTVNDDELNRLLGGALPQRPVQNFHAAVWFENGKVVENDPLRKRADFTISDINDPVLRLQERLSQKLQPLARFSAAVSFARQGKK